MCISPGSKYANILKALMINTKQNYRNVFKLQEAASNVYVVH